MSLATPASSLITYFSLLASGENPCSPTPLRCQAYETAPAPSTLACAVNVASAPASTHVDFGACEKTGASMSGTADVVTVVAAENALFTPCANAATLT